MAQLTRLWPECTIMFMECRTWSRGSHEKGWILHGQTHIYEVGLDKNIRRLPIRKQDWCPHIRRKGGHGFHKPMTAWICSELRRSIYTLHNHTYELEI